MVARGSELETREVEFQVDLKSSAIFFAVEKNLAEKLRSAARDRGVSADALLNVWLREHVAGDGSAK